MGKILVIDDEEYIGWVIKKAFENTDNEISLSMTGNDGLIKVQKQSYDIVFLDLRLPDIDGMDLLLELKKVQSDLAVIIITAHGSIDSAIESMKRGAYDYITKPFDVDELIIQAEKAMELKKLKFEVNYLRNEIVSEAVNFTSKNQDMISILNSINNISESSAAVLISGESGTGKELIAKRIHMVSGRRHYPFFAINCSTENEELIERELFGFEKDAFLGASQEKVGKLELAEKGTLYLEDIGDMSLKLQGKLLKVLQENEFHRIGGNNNIKLNIRIIASSRKNLTEAIEKGEFREDLYYRLNVISINIPPLRERKEDIQDLIDYFLQKYDAQKKIDRITPETMRFLKNYHWPGNIRELQNVIERIVILSDKNTITPNSLPQEITCQKRNAKEPVIYFPEEGINLEQVEKELIIKALKLSSQNQSKAAQLLSITRSALIYRMQKYHIN